jgi:hypothetical protein
VAKLAKGAYEPSATTWVKIKNRGYSKTEGRPDLSSLVTLERPFGFDECQLFAAPVEPFDLGVDHTVRPGRVIRGRGGALHQGRGRSLSY